jgi:hypothetical protein
MLMDFEWYYTDQRIKRLELAVTETEISVLDNFSAFLNEMIKDQDSDYFRNLNELIINPIWEKIRLESKVLLNRLGKIELDLEVIGGIKHSKGNEITIDMTYALQVRFW